MTLIFMGDFMPADDNDQQPKPPDFDPVAVSESMRTIADFAEQCAKNGSELGRDFASKAIEELRHAQAWLDARLADFDVPAQKPLITADEKAEQVGVEALVYTLRYAAIELLQVHKLLELRAFRRKKP